MSTIHEAIEPMTADQYLALQRELELHGQSIAMGQESNTTDATIAAIEKRMDESGWEFDPDLGVVQKQPSTSLKNLNDSNFDS